MSSLTDRWSNAIMGTYPTPALALVKGDGALLTDDRGRTYIDMLGGIAVNALGHGHPAVVEAVTRQVGQLGHVSNLYVAEPPVALAELLLMLAGRPGKVYFGNSGAEAVEAAYKISRRTGRSHVVAAAGAFHGRTMGALSLTGQPAKADPFRPLPGPVTHVPYGDAEALAAAVTDETAMVILEPIQGENGVVVPPPGYLSAARAITARRGALLALDEIQTGIGRTGHWFAHHAPNAPDATVEPDIITLAKGLGGGLPIGACLAFGPAADLLGAGAHGSTFGGNPVSCAAALAVLRTIARDGLLDHVRRVGGQIAIGVDSLGSPLVSRVRGAGLLIGIVLTAPVATVVVDALRDRAVAGGRPGFLANAPAPDVIRLAPPLILSADQAEAFVRALGGVLAAQPAGRASAVAPGTSLEWKDEAHAALSA
jgi:acetylornithine/N-succinyldiaminopimelate aminotransferase